MESIQIIAPLVGVVLGSVLSGIGTIFRTRAEQKSLVARALSDLLEIRHHVMGVELVLREVKNRVLVTEEEAQLFREHMNTLVPLDADIHRRYDEAISLLAGLDPILAFNMRSKNKVPLFLESIKSMSLSLGATPSQFSAYENVIRLAIAPALDNAVLELAAYHSLKTKRRVEKLVASTGDMPLEVTKLLNDLTATPSKETVNNETVG